MQPLKKQKRRGTIPLEQCNGPPKQLYSPGLKYLTIGDGDLSFSLSIIKWLHHAFPKNQSTFMTVTSYDSQNQLMQMYKHTFQNTLSQLQKLKNVAIFHQIDVNKLQTYKDKFFNNQMTNEGYDRIIWNFPHAGFPQQQQGDHRGPGFEWQDGFQQRHVDIITNFFIKAKLYLKKDGLAIMTHKTINPFGLWNIPKIGQSSGYILQKTIDFNIDDYPGYQNRRGAGKCGGKKFPCDDAKTYVFRQINQQNEFQKQK